MKYELAKELKDAGFPQEGHFWYVSEDGKNTSELMSVDAQEERTYMKLILVAPTLSELIAACGEAFSHMSRRDTGEYWVRARDSDVYHKGETPEEAVARLWLALQKNSSAQ